MRKRWTFGLVCLLLALVAQFPLAGLPAGAVQSGVECECAHDPAKEPYTAPKAAKAIAVKDNGNSPGNIYNLTAQPNLGGTSSITITRIATGATVLQLSVPSDSAWGFSPDDHRFVYHYLDAQTHNARLYNLQGSDPSSPVWQAQFTGSSIGIGFSPHGRYLLYDGIPSVQNDLLVLKVIEAESGASRIDTEFTFDQTFSKGSAGWGFSPDVRDRTFVYAYRTTPTVVQWRMVNLESGFTLAEVVDTNARWLFANCGDVLGFSTWPNLTQVDVRLIRTEDGSTIAGSERSFTAVTFALSATADSHILRIDGQADDVLADNTAAAACPVGAVLTSLTLSATSIVGGGSVTGTVTLAGVAPTGGTTVTLSDDSASTTLPGSVTVPAGQTKATFTVQTSKVTSATNVTVRATLADVTKSASLQIVPLAVSNVSLSPATVNGGENSTGKVQLNATAPAGGATVSLSKGSSAVSIPSSVNVPAGASQASFTVYTSSVATDTGVSISASLGGTTRSAELLILAPLLDTITLEAESVVGGSSTSGWVVLTGEAPSVGVKVSLSSSNPNLLTVPASVDVYEGWADKYFSIDTLGVADPTDVVITASAGAVTRAKTITILPANLTSVSFTTSECIAGDAASATVRSVAGFPVNGRVILDGDAPASGAVVSLGSSNPDLASVPSSVTVAAGTRFANFVVNTAAVTGTQSVTVSASYRQVEKQASISLIYLEPYNLVPLQGLSEALAINNNGQIVGSTAGGTMAIWDDGTTTELGARPGYDKSYAFDINDAGQVVGYSLLPSDPSNPHAFLWANGVYHDIGAELPEGYPLSRAASVNNEGQVAGSIHTADYSTTVPFVWNDGTAQALAPLPTFPTGMAYDINNLGHAVGVSDDYWGRAQGYRRATYWNGDQVVDISLLLGSDPPYAGEARAINDSGQVVVVEGDWNGYSNFVRGYVWREGEAALRLTPPWGYLAVEPYDINEQGEVIGRIEWNSSVDGRAGMFLHDGQELFNLNCWLPPDSELGITHVSQINDGGEIAGRVYKDGTYTGALLTRKSQAQPPANLYRAYIPLVVR